MIKKCNLELAEKQLSELIKLYFDRDYKPMCMASISVREDVDFDCNLTNALDELKELRLLAEQKKCKIVIAYAFGVELDFCGNCNERISEIFDFCPYCGSKIIR